MNQALASQSSAITSSTAPTAQIARLAPRLLLVAAATGLAVTAAAAFLDPAIGQPHHGAYIASGVVMSIVDFLTAVGLAGLAFTPAVREGRFKQVAFGTLVIASFAMVPAEVLLRVDFATGNGVYGIVGPIQALGLILVGIGIVRRALWTSWRRFVVLAMGLYVPLVMVPLMVSAGGTSLVALGGYHAFVLAIGLATSRRGRPNV
jgi:hypothetical protein